MKILFRILIGVGTLVGVTSCAKTDLEGPASERVIAAPIFKAVIENDTDGKSTKTVIDDQGKVSFCDGEKIIVNGAEYKYDADNEYFVPTVQSIEVTNNEINAYYPLSIYNNGNLTLPATYTFTDGFNMPLYSSTIISQSTSVSVPVKLFFYHITGFIALRVPAGTFNTITSVTVSTDKPMTGPFAISKDSENKPYATIGSSNTSKFVTVNFAQARSNSTDCTIYVPVPAQEYGKLMLSVEGTDSNSNVVSKHMITKDTKVVGGQIVTNTITITRNNLYKLAFRNNFIGSEVPVSTTETDTEDGRY